MYLPLQYAQDNSPEVLAEILRMNGVEEEIPQLTPENLLSLALSHNAANKASTACRGE